MAEPLADLFRRIKAEHEPAAREALALFRSYCTGHDHGHMPRVPGSDSIYRLAVRIDCGRSAEEAAAREYLYRWSLALTSARAFGAPHTIGL